MVNDAPQVCDDGRCRAFVTPPHGEPPRSGSRRRRGCRSRRGGAPKSTRCRAGRRARAARRRSPASRPRTFQSAQIVWTSFESMAGRQRRSDRRARQRGDGGLRPRAGLRAGEGATSPGPSRLRSQTASPGGAARRRQRAEFTIPARRDATRLGPSRRSTCAYENGARQDAITKHDWDDDLARPASTRRRLRRRPRRAPATAPGPTPHNPTARQVAASGHRRHRTHRRRRLVDGLDSHGPHPQGALPPLPRAPSKRGGAAGSAASAAACARPPAVKRARAHVPRPPFPVDKDAYLIGRSTTQSDLRLDEPNVSRQHAVVQNASARLACVVDLGSTNGVLRVGRAASPAARCGRKRLIVVTDASDLSRTRQRSSAS